MSSEQNLFRSSTPEDLTHINEIKSVDSSNNDDDEDYYDSSNNDDDEDYYDIFNNDDDEDYYDIFKHVEDCKSPYQQIWDMVEKRKSLAKKLWYTDEYKKMSDIGSAIRSGTPVSCTPLVDIIIDYIFIVHPDDMNDELERELELELELELERERYKKVYEVTVMTAKKKWYRTRSLARRWGCRWRWKRHAKAHAVWIALMWS
jgi:hypothetical protein